MGRNYAVFDINSGDIAIPWALPWRSWAAFKLSSFFFSHDDLVWSICIEHTGSALLWVSPLLIKTSLIFWWKALGDCVKPQIAFKSPHTRFEPSSYPSGCCFFNHLINLDYAGEPFPCQFCTWQSFCFDIGQYSSQTRIWPRVREVYHNSTSGRWERYLMTGLALNLAISPCLLVLRLEVPVASDGFLVGAWAQVPNFVLPQGFPFLLHCQKLIFSACRWLCLLWRFFFFWENRLGLSVFLTGHIHFMFLRYSCDLVPSFC